MSAIWLLGWPTKSTETCPSSLTIDVIHCASISSMPSCLGLYLASADGDAQLFSVCLFVCRPPHSGHLSESVFFHLKRFAAVASCCWKAFLTNVKSEDGSIFCVICDHLLINFPSNASFTALNVSPGFWGKRCAQLLFPFLLSLGSEPLRSWMVLGAARSLSRCSSERIIPRCSLGLYLCCVWVGLQTV